MVPASVVVCRGGFFMHTNAYKRIKSLSPHKPLYH
jgi:hypothetical protein